MSSRTCNHCGKEKKPSEFNWRYKKLGIRQPTCRECSREQINRWYAKNKETHKARTWDQKVQRRNEAKNFIQDYFVTHPCVDCGESNPIVLEFDHVRGKKKASISKMTHEGYLLHRIQKEIVKCEVRCANCHRKKTYNERGWYRD